MTDPFGKKIYIYSVGTLFIAESERSQDASCRNFTPSNQIRLYPFNWGWESQDRFSETLKLTVVFHGTARID